PVIVQTLAALRPVNVSVPAPPSSEPDNDPLAPMVKLSLFVPPIKFAKLAKVKVDDAPVKLPLLLPLMLHEVAAFSPVNLLAMLAAEVNWVMLEKPLPIGF